VNTLLVLVLVVEFRISRCTPQKLLGVAIVAAWRRSST
jgi:hypothetical protein